MNALMSLLSIGLIIYSIFSVIVYYSRRSDSKSAMKSLLTSEPHRQLTDDERAIVAELSPKEGIQPDVYYIEGEFARHGLHTQNGEVWHDAIGGIEVELPYSSKLFLAQANKAEVIAFDKKKMLVISLNEQFTLTEGYKVAQAEKRRDQQWQQGEPGEIKDDTLLNYITDNQLTDELGNQLNYKILNHREETQAEREYRYHPGFKIFASIFLAIGFICLIQTNFIDFRGNVFGLISLITFLIGLFLLLKNRKLQKPRRVNLVQGILYQDDDDKEIYLGGHRLVVPEGWKAQLELSKRERVYDITTDYHLLRANELSVDRQKTKRVFWGKHVLPALVGIIALICGLGIFNQIKADWYYTLNFIKGNTPTTYTSAADLKNNLPKAGMLVTLKGPYRCWLSKSNDKIRNSCHVQLYGAPQKIAEPLKIDPNIKELINTEWFKKAHLNVFTKLYLSRLARKNHKYINFNSLSSLVNPSEFVQLLEIVCEKKYSDCAQAKSQFAELFHVDSWDEAQDKALSRKTSIFKNSAKNNLEYSLKNIGDEYAKAINQKLLSRLYQQSKQGILISLTPTTGIDTYMVSKQLYHPWDTLLFNQKLAVGDIAQTSPDHEVTGIITSAEKGQPIKINNRYQYPLDYPDQYLISVIFMILASILALWQSILLIWRLNRRDKQIIS